MLHFHSIVDERPTCRVLCFALTFIGFVACGGAAYRLDDAPRVTTAVSIDAPAGCALQARLREALGDHMGSVSFDVRAEGQVQMRVQLSQSSEGWAASIRTTSASGELLGIRELTLPADSCEDAGEALAFVAELVVDTPAVAAAVEAAEEAPARPGPRVYLGAAASGALGRSPSPSASLGVFTSASWRAFELRFGAFGLLPGSEGGLRRVRIGGAELRGEACPAFSVGTGRFAFCGGLAGGLLRAEGSGFVQDRSSLGGHLDATLAFRPSIRWRRLLLGLDALFGVALLRPRFAFVQAGETQVFFESDRVWGGFGLSVGLRLR